MTLAAGQSLAHYRVLGPLGAGAMGEVYRAKDTRLGREVALKVLPEELAGDPERLQRFEREAKALAALSHTNLAHVYGIDQVGDTCFIAMELVPGEDLARRLERGPLPVDVALDVGWQIARGLEAAHDAGVVHRDLKPANVRITPDGVVKVLDFGLAKVLDAEATTAAAGSDTGFPRTEEGRALGTLPYMSPEQARGEGVGRSTDVWALGCVLYECLTGKRPFRGDTSADVLVAILHGDPDWSALPARTPADVRELLRRALTRDARQRLHDAGEARRALDAARRPSAPAPAVPRWALAAALLLALLALLRWTTGWPGGGGATAPPVGDGDRALSIAVLPFRNLGGDPATAPFVDGLHEDLITRLSNVDSLTVISRRSTARFEDSDLSIPEIARELGAQVVLEASVQRVDASVRLTAQLTDAATDSNLWGDHVDEDFALENLFEVQARLAERIVGRLTGELNAGERAVIRQPATRDPQAFEKYVQGRDSWLKLNAPALERALRYFDEAIARDASFALAHAAKADTYLAMEFVGAKPLDEAVALARASVDAALAIDQDLAEARSALGHVLLHKQDGPRARIELARAIRLKPSFLEAHMLLGMSLLDWGRLDEAEARTGAALRIDPLSTYGAWGEGLVRLARDEPESAAEHFRRAIAVDDLWVGHYELAWALAALGRHEEALRELEQAREMNRGALAEEFGLESTVAAFQARAGDTEGARRRLEALAGTNESSFGLGLAHAALGDRDSAFDLWLRQTQWTILLPAHFRYGALPDGVREDLRYRDVLAAIDAQWGWSAKPERATASDEARGPLIAVLPFAGQDDFGLGLCDEIVTALSRYPDLRVISRTQTRQLVSGSLDVQQLARQLGGARYVLEGNVRRSDQTLKVDAWLTDTLDASQIWADDYRVNLTAVDLFQAQEDLTLKVVNAIAAGHGELSRAELARKARAAPENLDSYLCVLRAYWYWHAHSPENHREARACLETAVALDPDYAEAWALLAYMYVEEYHHQWNERPGYDALQRSLETARKAVRMDSASQVAHGVLALIHSFQGDRERFLVEARTAIALNPGNSDWLAGLGTSYAQLGFFEQGSRLVRQALDLNPTPMPWLFMAFFLDRYHDADYEAALAEALRTDTTDFRTPLYRAATYGQLGQPERARADLAELTSHPETDTAAEIHELLIRRNGYDVGLADHLIEGLRKAGLDR